jgi:ribose 5-phosphate isomerase A
VEVIPLARWIVAREIKSVGLVPTLRLEAAGHSPFLTENGNLVVDCVLPESLISSGVARALEQVLLAIVGVVDTGLFLGTADRVLVGHPDGSVATLRRTEERSP